jgi:signal transduction histidine kinase
MRLRLILSFTLIVFVSVASVVLIARQGAAREVRAYMFRGGMTGVEGLVAALEDHYRSTRSWQGAEELLSPGGHGQGMGHGMGPGMMNQRLRLAGPAGELLVDTAGVEAGGQLSQAELANAIPLQVDGRTVGYLLPEGGVAFGQNQEGRLLARINRAALIAGLIAGGFSLLLALVLGYRLLRPVQALTQAATRLAQGDLSQRVGVQGRDELAILGASFNQMASSLEKAKESRRAMTADIAHELRTPLSVQRAHLEALQDGIYALTPENISPVLEQNLILARLVDDLGTLAQADAGQLSLDRVPTDLAALIQRVAERFRPQAEARQVQIQLSSAASCPPLNLDPGRVEQILGNLLSNALRYTPGGGRVELALSCSAGLARLTVHDSGPGIPPEALPQIFERFYRADRARSRAEGGSGLGLAIARRLAEAHGGSLTAENHPEGGAVFTLELPVNTSWLHFFLDSL